MWRLNMWHGKVHHWPPCNLFELRTTRFISSYLWLGLFLIPFHQVTLLFSRTSWDTTSNSNALDLSLCSQLSRSWSCCCSSPLATPAILPSPSLLPSSSLPSSKKKCMSFFPSSLSTSLTHTGDPAAPANTLTPGPLPLPLCVPSSLPPYPKNI